MPQMNIAPQSMPIVASAQAGIPGGAAETSAGKDAGTDFASVLKAQIAQPAKDAPETEIIAALVPQAADGDEATQADQAEGLPSANAIAALIPALAGLTPTPVADNTTITQPGDTGTGSKAAPDAAPALLTAPSATPSLSASPGATAQAALNGSPESLASTAADSAHGKDAAIAALSPHHADAPAARPVPGESVTNSPDDAAPQIPAAATPDRAKPPLITTQAPAREGGSVQPAAGEPLPASTALAAHVSDSPAASGAAPLAHTAHADSAPATIRIETPVGNRGWDVEVGQKIVLLANRQDSRAELTLTPPQLGKVDITISVHGDQTSATFVSASPAAREALEQALPRLREMLADAGITLGQANVNAESARRDQEEYRATGAVRGAATGNARGSDAATLWERRSNGLIDTFA